jgi:hypothetical protein
MAQCKQLLLFDLTPYTVTPTRAVKAEIKPGVMVVSICPPMKQLELDLSIRTEPQFTQSFDLAA